MSETMAVVQKSPLIALATRFNIEPGKLLTVLKGTVFKPHKDGRPASDEEVAALCIVAQQYSLNPFTKEIYAFPDGKGGIVPLVPVDGWCHIVNARPDFNGCEFAEIEDSNGIPVSVTCRMFVKGREHPVTVTERFTECRRNTGPWTQMPWRMLRHKAYMQAARYAFGLSGIYDEDEARDIVDVTPTVTAPKPIRKAVRKNQFDDVMPVEEAPKAEHPKAADPEPAAPPAAPEPPAEPAEPEFNEQESAVADLIAELEPIATEKPTFFKKGCKTHGIPLDMWRKAPAGKLSDLLDSLR